MTVSAPDLNINVSIITGCSGLQLVDNTGIYPAAPFGYGLSTGPTVNNVTQLVITLTYGSLNTNAVYTFTLSSGVVTAATLSLAGATAVNILANLSSTTWPFTSANAFNLTKDYGVTLPQFSDDVYKVDYNITGTVPSTFNFTTTVYLPVGCNLRCCINKKWQALDPSCGCSSDKTKQCNYLEAVYQEFFYAAQAGDLDRALAALRQGQQDCGQTGGCGC